MRLRCWCQDVEIGTYANAIPLWPSPELGLTRVPVTVDRCIAGEIVWLWSQGVVTSGNCCGHNMAPPFISVKGDASVARMRELGYETFDLRRQDHFLPKSLMHGGDCRASTQPESREGPQMSSEASSREDILGLRTEIPRGPLDGVYRPTYAPSSKAERGAIATSNGLHDAGQERRPSGTPAPQPESA